MRPYTIEEHWEAGVRASMLRPRLMWSSISPAQPAIRPKRKAVKAALSRASSENAPERQRCQCVFESNAAMTASMFAQKALGVTPRPSSPFSSAQTRRRSVRQRIPAILSFLSVYRSAIATFAGSCCRRSDACVSSCRKIRLRRWRGRASRAHATRSAFGCSFFLTRQKTDGSQTRQFQSG